MWMTLLYITRLGISPLQLVGLWELRSRHPPSSSCWATSPSIHVLCQLSTAHSLQVRCGACYIFRSSSFFVHISFCVTYYCITKTESDSFIITPVQCILYSLKLKCIYHALHLACFIGVKVCYIEPHQGKWKFNPNHGPWKVKVKICYICKWKFAPSNATRGKLWLLQWQGDRGTRASASSFSKNLKTSHQSHRSEGTNTQDPI